MLERRQNTFKWSSIILLQLTVVMKIGTEKGISIKMRLLEHDIKCRFANNLSRS